MSRKIRQILVVSGKGGTGKTGITAALAAATRRGSLVLADCDVDAANLCFLAGGTVEKNGEFFSGFLARVDENICNGCNACSAVCKFDAIRCGRVDELECEGCGACLYACPLNAVKLEERQAGNWMLSSGRFGKLAHAELGTAIENSGKLVSKVRTEALAAATAVKAGRIIIDGPPGIGCPVIAAATGVDIVLAVVEPSVAAFHDLERLAKLMRRLQLPVLVCINKCTLNPRQADEIALWCAANNCPVVARIPYSDIFPRAIAEGRTVLDSDADREVTNGIFCILQEIERRLPDDDSLSSKFGNVLGGKFFRNKLKGEN